MRQLLSTAFGVKGRVRKRRVLYIIGQTRVHIDDVEGLGSFLELEVVLDDSDSVEKGQRIAEEIMSRFGICSADLLDGAYVDMLLQTLKSSQK